MPSIRSRNAVVIPLLCLLALGAGGCSKIAFEGADQASTLQVDPEVVDAIAVPDGFRAVVVAEGLNYPSAVTFGDDGTIYVLESNTVPVPLLDLAVRRIRGDEVDELELTGEEAPSGEIGVGLTWHNGALYLSHEQEDGTFGISRIDPGSGRTESVLRGLPTRGDHDVNYLVFDRAGNLYFGLGSATNSGVVSSRDPVNQKWLEKIPDARDVPCRELVLTGRTFTDDNALTDEEGDRAETGAFQPYGQAGATRIPGRVPCSGAVFRLAPGAAEPELLAWGFRNPVALALDAEERLYVGMHGADVRGTRPVLDDPDSILLVREGAWYGWPDYSAALLPFTDERYQPPQEYLAPGHTAVELLIDHEASGLSAPDRSLLIAATEPHAAIGGMTFVPEDGPFARWAGQLLVSEMGDFKPVTDAVNPRQRAGFQVERLDISTGELTPFLYNRDRRAGDAWPASDLDLENGFERPVDVKFGPDGLLYVLDFGVLTFYEGQQGFPKTGRLFRIEPLP